MDPGGRTVLQFVPSRLPVHPCQKETILLIRKDLERLPQYLRASLAILLQAHRYSEEFTEPAWEFAVEIRCLRSAGCSHSDLRWLERAGYVEHAIETTAPQASGRTFCPISNLSLDERSCFVLTEAGLVLAVAIHEACAPTSARLNAGTASSTQSRDNLVPLWDPERRQLWLSGFVVKRFRRPAPNQEAILAAFEEGGWPVRVDDPIPPIWDINSKQRLHDTINHLNRNQVHRLIAFRGDGNGLGVCWELLLPDFIRTASDRS